MECNDSMLRALVCMRVVIFHSSVLSSTPYIGQADGLLACEVAEILECQVIYLEWSSRVEWNKSGT